MDFNYFIWTDSIGSLEDTKNSINSFLKLHNNLHLNVFAFEEDIKLLPKSINITYHKFPKISYLKLFKFNFLDRYEKIFKIKERLIIKYLSPRSKFRSIFWSYILKKYMNKSFIIHFNNSITFKSPAIFSLIENANEYDLIGVKRNIKDDIRYKEKIYSHGIEPSFFLFKPSLVPSISRLTEYSLAKLIQGKNKNNKRIIFQFFDNIYNELVANNGKTKKFSKKQFDSLVSLRKNS